jgi:hypothetical protein
MTEFHLLKQKYSWRPIYGCPGRYLLKNSNPDLTIEELVGEPLHIQTFQSANATDPVLIVRIKNGGIISYKKQNQTYVHTLNTDEGFIKKIKILNIDPALIK